METQTLIAVIAVFGALAGSAVGGAISFLSSRAIRRYEVQLSLHQKEIERRMVLYASFVTESNRLALEPSIAIGSLAKEFVLLASLQSQIDITAEALGALAMTVLHAVLDEVANNRIKAPKEDAEERTQEPYSIVRDRLVSAFRKDIAQLKQQV